MRIWCAALAAVTVACGLDTSGDGVEGGSSTADSPTSGNTASTAGPGTPGTTPGTTTVADTSTTASTTGDTATTDAPTGTTDEGTTGAPVSQPFGPLLALGELNANDASDDDPTLRGDLLEIYFATNRGNGLHEDLWRARRESPDDDFDEPEPVMVLNVPGFNDSTPELSDDGLTLWFASDRTNSGHLDVYVTSRRSTDPLDEWGQPERVEDLSSALNEGAPVLTADGLQGWFCRAQPDSISALFRATRTRPDDGWDVAPFAALDTAQEECSPWVSAEGGEVWFGSNRPEGAGAFDIWIAEVAGDEAMSLRNLEEINGLGNDDDPWLSADGSTLVFASDRDGTYDLFVTTRTVP